MKNIPLYLASLLILPCHAHSAKRRERVLDLIETVRLEVPRDAERLRLWIPRPVNDELQSARLLEVRSPWPHQATTDPEFGNPLLFLETAAPPSGPVEIELRYRIARREQHPASARGAVLPAYREGRGLVVVNEEIRRIARETTAGLADPFEKARALYYYVLSRMDYDKSGQGWGRGDVLYACKSGKGNCTDFHSLFIALALAESIPARFRMGFSVPREPEGPIHGSYHCWAEFNAPPRGWVPVDISEAWKKPSRAAYFFGNLDESRVLVSTGRDIRLEPLQSGEPLNYLSRPYAEIDGKPLEALEFKRAYKELRWLGGRSGGR